MINIQYFHILDTSHYATILNIINKMLKAFAATRKVGMDFLSFIIATWNKPLGFRQRIDGLEIDGN